jgi:DNA-binding response OmpR family regulator
VRILVVEEDPALLRILERGLRAHGFELVAADTIASAVHLAVDHSIDLVLLDTCLPGFVATDVLGQLRATRAHLPVIFLTQPAADTRHILSDALGADDCMLKPFAFEELIGRIRAKTRAAEEPAITTLRAGDLRIDLLARCAWRGERVIDLPIREFALLEYFMRHRGRVLSRTDILVDVWGYSFASESNLVDVYVRYLRHRIDRPGERSLVTSVRGVGYRFDSADESADGLKTGT